MIIPFRKKKDPFFLLSHKKYALLIALAFLVLSYFFLDRPIAAFFQTLPSSLYQLSGRLTDTIYPYYHLALWPVLYFIFRYLYPKPRIAQFALFLLLSIACTNLGIEFLKWLLGRARPELWLTHQIYGFSLFASSNLYHSFPSGHAGTAGAIAGVLSCYRPEKRMLFFIGAFCLAYTRILLEEHFFSDVLAGMVIGLVCAQWIFRVLEKEHSFFLAKK